MYEYHIEKNMIVMSGIIDWVLTEAGKECIYE